jgi:hypothetical protein
MCCRWRTAGVSALIQRRQAHEMEDCLSAVSEAVAEVTGPPSSKMPAGAEAPGSEGMIDSPGRTVRRKKNKGRSRYGPGRLERHKRQALICQSQGCLCKGRPEGNRSHPGAPPVRAVLWRGVGSHEPASAVSKHSLPLSSSDNTSSSCCDI